MPKQLRTISGGRWLVLAALAMSLASCDREPAAWQDAEALGQATGYEAYLQVHPEGAHAVTARERLEGLAWTRAGEAADRESYGAYLDAFPDGRHAAEALDRIVSLDWEAARRAHDSAAYAEFAEAHPESAEAEDARRLAGLTALAGDWVLGGYEFLISPSADGGASVEPVLVEASPGDNRLILERIVSNVAAADDGIRFHHTVTTESHSGTGVVINDREIVTVSQDHFRSEYDLKLAGQNRLSGVNFEGYLDPGSTGFHKWEAQFFRIADRAPPATGVFGLWAGDDYPSVVRFSVDAEGNVTVSSSPDTPRMLQGAVAEATYELEAIDESTIAFSERLEAPGDYRAAAFKCSVVASHHLACVVRVTCSVCTEATVASTTGLRRYSDDPSEP